MKKRTILVVLPVWLLLAGLVLAADHPVNVTPDEAIHRLADGNLRFSQGKSTHPNSGSARVVETGTNGQHPFATILSCSDSRCRRRSYSIGGSGTSLWSELPETSAASTKWDRSSMR